MSNKNQIMGLIDDKPTKKRREGMTKSFDMQTAKKDLPDFKESPKQVLTYQYIVTCNIDSPEKQNVLSQSMKIIRDGLNVSPKDKTLILVRSYIQFYRHNFYEALCDIEQVIEIERASSGEEEPNATDLLHQGRCHACLSMFKEAIADFTKVIELDDELFDAYFFRGKCCYLVGDTSQAFLDFQKLIML